MHSVVPNLLDQVGHTLVFMAAHSPPSERSRLLNVNGEHDEVKPGKLTAYLVFCATVMCVSAFNYGYHISVLDIPAALIKGANATAEECAGSTLDHVFPSCFHMSESEWGLVQGIYYLGGMTGGIMAGYFADLLGRRNVVIASNVFSIAGPLIVALSINTSMLMGGRFVIGLGGGASSVAVPMYIGEISPPNLRGAFGTYFQLILTIGILVAQLFGLVFNYAPGWRWLNGLTIGFSLGQLLLIPFCVESPRFLVRQRQIEQANAALVQLRASDDVDAEVQQIMLAQSHVQEEKGLAIARLLSHRGLWTPLFVAVMLSLAQQFSGINIVFAYSSSLFAATMPEYSQLLTIMIGLWNVLLTVLAVYLMDKLGRRPLLLFGEAGMATVAVFYVISYVYDISVLGVICTFMFVLTFAVGLGPIPFIIISEIFPTAYVATASSVAVPVNWLSNFVVVQLFPIMSLALTENYVFIPFIATNVVAVVLTFILVPETKGRTIEDITSGYGLQAESDTI